MPGISSAEGEGRVFRLLIGQLLYLVQSFLEQILRRHAVVFHADIHIGGDLIEGVGKGVQAGDPVVVVLNGVEAELGHEARILGVDAVHLVEGHLPLFELGGLLVLVELAQQQVLADLFLISETGWVDGREAKLEPLLAREPVVDGLHGVIADLVVVTQVADDGGELGIVLELVFPVVVEEIVEGLAAVGKRRWSGRSA